MTSEQAAHSEGARAATQANEARAAAAVQTGATWQEACDAVLAALDLDTKPDLALAFIDSRFSADYAAVLERLRAGTGAQRLVGASGMGVIGPGHEAEDQPAISLLALSLPRRNHHHASRSARATRPPRRSTASRRRPHRPGCCSPIPSPRTPRRWLTRSASASRARPSWAASPRRSRCSATPPSSSTARWRESGAVLVGIGGAFGIHTIVAQGAEPIGQPWTVTACEGNVVRSIGSRPALEVLQETLAALDPATRERAQRNLLVGLAMDEYRHQHARGDFLIRNILGGDRESGAIAIKRHAAPRPDAAVPVPRRRGRRPRSARTPASAARASGARRAGARRAALLLQRPRAGPLRRTAPRRTGAGTGAGPDADRRDVLQRRDRPRRRQDLRTRLHRQHRAAHHARIRQAMTRIVVTFALEPEHAEQIRAVDPSLEVSVLGQDLLAALRGKRRFPSERQAVTPLAGPQGGARRRGGAVRGSGAARYRSSCGPPRCPPSCAGCSSPRRAPIASTRR